MPSPIPSVSAGRQTHGRDGGASGEAGHPLGGDAPVGDISTKKGMSRQRVQAGSVSLERLGQDEGGDLISTFSRPWSDGSIGIKLSTGSAAARVKPAPFASSPLSPRGPSFAVSGVTSSELLTPHRLLRRG
jgi:hypothetical protein